MTDRADQRYTLLGMGSATLMPGFGSPHPCWDDLRAAYAHLHRLGLPGAPDPPYVRMSEDDSLDKLRSIANALRHREDEANTPVPRAFPTAANRPAPPNLAVFPQGPSPPWGGQLTDQHRIALREHAERIEGYEAKLEAERLRLAAPEQIRMKEIWEDLHRSERSPLPNGLVPCRPVSKETEREIVEKSGKLQDALATFNSENRPDLTPWDTPARLMTWIDEDCGLSILLIDQQKRATHRDGSTNNPEADYRQMYRKARGRALAFARMVPGLPALLPEAQDPIVGLQNLRAWCEDAIRPAAPCPESAPSAFPVPVEADNLEERVKSTSVHASSQEISQLPAGSAQLAGIASRPGLGVFGRALAAIHELVREGKPVTLSAVARRAQVDRSHLSKKYGDEIRKIVRALELKGRPPRGLKDGRTGELEAYRDEEE